MVYTGKRTKKYPKFLFDRKRWVFNKEVQKDKTNIDKEYHFIKYCTRYVFTI